MRASKKTLVFTLILCAILSAPAFAQHPNHHSIDSLEEVLASGSSGRARIDCMNSIGEEYWWPTMTAADTITYWANRALNKSGESGYEYGKARALMLLGVAEIFRKHFNTAEVQLRNALVLFEKQQSDFGLGWCNVWLGQTLYSLARFDEALKVDKRSAIYMEKTGDWEGQGKTWAWIGMLYATLGNYDSSFLYSTKSLNLRQQMSDHLCVLLTYVNMGHLYRMAGSPHDAMDYFHKGYEYLASHHVRNAYANWTYFEGVGNTYKDINGTDSAIYFLQKSMHLDSSNAMSGVSYGETLLKTGKYDSALFHFQRPVAALRAGHDNWNLMRILFDESKAYQLKGDDRTALRFARETYALGGVAGARPFMREVYLTLSQLYQKLRSTDSAYYFLQQYTSLRDSILNNQFLFRLSNYKKQEDFRNKADQLALLQAADKAKEDKLKADKLITLILVIFLFVVALSAFFIYKNLALKRKNEKLENSREQAELRQHLSALEMQALRAQMNPHFIFNCLSSINSFILKGDNDAASTYLTRFSRLVRMVLSNSQKAFIGIEDEIEMLCLYLEMEKLRFKDSFEYRISYANAFDRGNVQVPPLLLQPFAENAIWHGLMHKPGPGVLEIVLSEENRILTCVISDNGIGRAQAESIKSRSAEKRKSMGLRITSQRLELLNEGGEQSAYFTIEDIPGKSGNSGGTRVVMKIKYRELSEVIIEDGLT